MAVVLMSAGEGLLLYKIILADDFEWHALNQLFTETFISGLVVHK